jgi:excisionase family DNA binding protein
MPLKRPLIDPSEQRCNPREAMEVLGYQRLATIYDLIKSGRLPAQKLPGSHRWRIRVSDLRRLNRGESNEGTS